MHWDLAERSGVEPKRRMKIIKNVWAPYRESSK